MVSTAITLTLAIIGTTIITAATYYSPQVQEAAGYQAPADGSFDPEVYIINLLISLILVPTVIIGNVMLFAVQPPLASDLERHHTYTSMLTTMMLKMISFQVFNTVAAAAIFAVPVDDVSRLDSYWYLRGGSLIATIILGDAVFIQTLLELGRPDALINRGICAR